MLTNTNPATADCYSLDHSADLAAEAEWQRQRMEAQKRVEPRIKRGRGVRRWAQWFAEMVEGTSWS